MAVNEPRDDLDGQSTVLPCGRDTEQIWQRMSTGLPADVHESDCEHCRPLRDGFELLRQATMDMLEESLEAPPYITERVMSAIRAESRRGDSLTFPAPEPGEIWISTHAITTVIRDAAATVSGVRAGQCSVRRHDDAPVVGAVVAGGAVDVELDLAVSMHGFTVAALEEVRGRVIAAMIDRVGVQPRRLDLRVSDVYDD